MLKFIVLFFAAFAVFSPLFLIGILSLIHI